MAENLRFAQVDPGQRIQRVGVGGRDAAEVGRRIALDVEELVRRPFELFQLRHIGHLDTRDVSGHQRVAIDVSISGDIHHLIHLRGIGRRGNGHHAGEQSPEQQLADGTQPGIHGFLLYGYMRIGRQLPTCEQDARILCLLARV